MNGKIIHEIKIAESIDELSFGANELTEVVAEGKTICIGKYKNQLFAFPATCPHASGRLCEGFIDALGNIVCPVHHYKFSMKTGRNVTGEGYYLKHWPVEIRQDGVFISIENKFLFNHL